MKVRHSGWLRFPPASVAPSRFARQSASSRLDRGDTNPAQRQQLPVLSALSNLDGLLRNPHHLSDTNTCALFPLPIYIVICASCCDRRRRLITAPTPRSPANRHACFQGLTDREEVHERRRERQAAYQHPAKDGRRNRPPQKGAYFSVQAFFIPRTAPGGQTPLGGPGGWLASLLARIDKLLTPSLWNRLFGRFTTTPRRTPKS